MNVLKLQDMKKYPWGFQLNYIVSHSTPGADGTTLEADMTMDIAPDKTTVNLAVATVSAPTQEEAIKNLAEHLERLAKAIRDPEQKTLTIPV